MSILMVQIKVLKIINHIIVLLTFSLRLFNFLELKKSNPVIGIIDYGLGNLKSFSNILKRFNSEF